MLIKPKGSPLLHFSALCDIFWKKRIQKIHLKKICPFWALDIAPTLDVPVLFFLQASILTLIGPLFRNKPETTKPPKAKSRQGKLSPKGPLSFFTFSGKPTKPDVPKGSPLWIFFRHCATFFRKFFNVSKESPFRVLWYFATEYMLIKPKGSPFYIFQHYATFSERKEFKKFIFYKKIFCAFWALDIAPTLDVPVLFLFFRQTIHSSRMYHFLWIIHFYQKYSVLDFERIQRPLPWNAKPRRVPLPIFRRYETFPPLFSFVRLFFEIFQSLQRVPFTFFGTMRLLKNLIFRFLENFLKFFEIFQSPKGRYFIFLIFCNKLDFQKALLQY